MTTSPDTSTIATRGGLAAAVAVLANAAVVLVAQSLGVAPGFRALTLPPVIFLSALGAVGATAVYWGLARRTADPDRTFVRIATAVLVLSFVPDFALLGADPSATVPGVVLLMLMHVVVAAAVVGLLVYWRADS